MTRDIDGTGADLSFAIHSHGGQQRLRWVIRNVAAASGTRGHVRLTPEEALCESYVRKLVTA